MSKENTTVKLTEGVIWKQLLIFAGPIILANLFQQIYNTTNSFIVGNYVSTDALSAVSATASIENLFSYFFWGFSVASSILVSHLYGSGDQKKTCTAIETSIFMAFVIGIFLTIIGEIGADLLLSFSNIRPDIYPLAELYIRVYMLGNVAVFLYNIIFFIIRSLGDSKHPLNYLIYSCVLNILMGVVFVKYLNMGVVGVALATVLSQLVVYFMALRLLKKMLPDIETNPLKIKIDPATVKRLFALAIPSSCQDMLIAISTYLVQAKINLFPNVAIAGIGVAIKIGWWIEMPMQGLATAEVSFVGQNLGAGKYDRLKESIRICNILGAVVTLFTGTVVFLLAPQIVSLFDSDPTVIQYGTAMIRYTAYSYIPLTLSHVYNGTCRGGGNVRAPMVISVCTQAIFKYLFIAIGLAQSFDVRVIYLGTAVSYVLAGIVATIYFKTSSWTLEMHMR